MQRPGTQTAAAAASGCSRRKRSNPSITIGASSPRSARAKRGSSRGWVRPVPRASSRANGDALIAGAGAQLELLDARGAFGCERDEADNVVDGSLRVAETDRARRRQAPRSRGSPARTGSRTRGQRGRHRRVRSAAPNRETIGGGSSHSTATCLLSGLVRSELVMLSPDRPTASASPLSSTRSPVKASCCSSMSWTPMSLRPTCHSSLYGSSRTHYPDRDIAVEQRDVAAIEQPAGDRDIRL